MKEKNLSAADVARNAGNDISPTVITKILNGEIKKSGAKTLGLIAKGLDVPTLDLFRVANGEDLSRPLHYQIYAERLDGEDLDDTEWQFLEFYFKQYVDSFRAGKAQRNEHIKKMIADSLNSPAEQDDKIIARIGSPKTESKKAA